MRVKTAKRTPSTQDLSALLDLIPVLGKWGIYDVCCDRDRFRVSVTCDGAVNVIRSLELTPVVTARPASTLCNWDAVHQGVKFFGVIRAEDLPSIGYHMLDGKPVPAGQTA